MRIGENLCPIRMYAGQKRFFGKGAGISVCVTCYQYADY